MKIDEINSILESIPFFIFRVNNKGEITFINKFLLLTFELNELDYLNNSYHKVINCREHSSDELDKLIFNEKNDFQIIRSNYIIRQENLVIEWKIVTVQNNCKIEYQFNGNDITDRIRIELANQEKVDRLAMLHAFNAVAPQLSEIKMVFRELYELFSTFFPNIDRTSVLLYDKESNSLFNEEETGLKRISQSTTYGHQPVGTSISGKCFLQNKVIYIPDCSQTDLIPSRFIEQLGLKSTVAIPIRHHNKPIGVLRIDNKKFTNAFDETEIQFFSLFADQFGMFLENLRIIEELNKATKIVEESEAKYRALVTNLPEVFFVYYNRKVLFANDRVLNLLGFTNEEIIGTDVLSYVHPNYHSLVLENVSKRMIGDSVQDYEIECLTKNGDTRWVIVRGQPLQFQGKNCFLNVLIDITERKYYEKKLSEYSRQLKEINSAKDKFFTIIAHDLKSPLFGSLGVAEFFASNAGTFSHDELVKVSNALYLSLKNQYELLEDLLTWSRLEMGVLIPNLTFNSPSDSVRKIINLLENRATEKSIEIISNVNASSSIKYDINMFELLIRNLIFNAIKFSHSGSKVFVDMDEKEDTFIFSIKDSGLGISKEEADKLFKIDVHHSTIGTKNESGTGLGLILCKEIIEKHYGKIWVESQKDIGSTFYFSIPKLIN